ncbi:NAD(P)H-dependent oxidoreductase [Methanobrevibacter sp. TMH8]|uniref:flavodoxin family protein n=1 Tax=Methanobrevibacter sp. TMH8 TaxID=2848611 RepID=UPI001CC9DA06|nr:flavodoxin [Methanobrevibacter sp. TMH8]MBZ9571474.1 NAD(P)H-dependent oxidoreductase [Methanobrevibacter sp. TMH8]
MKTVIIYFSESGKTKAVAKTLSKNLDTDLIEVRDLKNRNGFVGKVFSSIDAFRESKTNTVPSRVDLQNYGLIYFGTPTWAGNATPAIITIIDKCDLRGKDIVLFATMNSSGGRSAINRMKEKVESRGARVVETFTIKTKDKSVEKVGEDSENIAKLLDLSLYNY